jgi:hypothetical protein
VASGAEPGDAVWFRISDLSLITPRLLERRVKMARLVGTGTDPRFPAGQPVDVPAYDPFYDDIVEKGWATELAPEDDPARTTEQIANAMVRGDPLTSPVEQAIAEEIGENALAVVHTGDETATKERGSPELPTPKDAPGIHNITGFAYDEARGGRPPVASKRGGRKKSGAEKSGGTEKSTTTGGSSSSTSSSSGS